MKRSILVLVVVSLFVFFGTAFAQLTDTQQSYSGESIDSTRSTQDTSWVGSESSGSDTSNDTGGDIEV